MAAGSNPPASPLVFVAQAGSAHTHTGLIGGGGGHGALLMTPLMLCSAGTGRETDKRTDGQTGYAVYLKRSGRYQPVANVCVCVCVCALPFVAVDVLLHTRCHLCRSWVDHPIC